MTKRDEQAAADPREGGPEGEVLISGLDTGPSEQERNNTSPTDSLAALQPAHPAGEPEDEDG